MIIRFTKKEHRCQLTYQRHDGEMLVADLGPDLPGHDLAHFVIEQKLGMRTGFYGNLYAGYTMAQLGDKEVFSSSEVFMEPIVTTCNGALIETRGMLKITAEQNGNELALAPNKAIELTFHGTRPGITTI